MLTAAKHGRYQCYDGYKNSCWNLDGKGRRSERDTLTASLCFVGGGTGAAREVRQQSSC